MTIRHIQGWESGVVSPGDAGTVFASGAKFVSTAQSCAIVTSPVHHGTKALRLGDGSNGISVSEWRMPTTGTADNVVSFMFRLGALPVAGQVRYVWWCPSTNVNAGAHIWVDENGVIKVRIGGSNSPVSGPTVGAGQWYRLDAIYDQSGTTHTVDYAIDGTAQTQVTQGSLAAATNGTWISLGANNSSSGDLFLDCYAHSTVQGDYPLGEVVVKGYAPDSDDLSGVGSGAFVDAAGTAISAGNPAWDNLDSRDLEQSTERIEQTATATGFIGLGFENSAESTNPLVIQVEGAFRADSTTACQIESRLRSGTNEDTWAIGDPSEANNVKGWKLYATEPTSGAAWTNTLFNAVQVRVGYSTDANPDPWCTALVIEAAFQAASVISKTATDSRTYAESITRVGSFHPSATDSKTLGDSVARIGTFLRTVADTLGHGDFATNFVAKVRTATDSRTYAESITRVGSFLRSLTDSRAHSEDVVPQVTGGGAPPAIRSHASYVTTASETSLPVPVPAGVVDGDVLFMAVYLTSSTGSITTPGGWTPLFANSVPASSTSSHASLFRRVASSEPSSYSVTVTSGRASASMIAVTGVDTTTPEDVTGSAVDTTAGLSVVAPDVTASASSLLLSWFGGRVLGNGFVAQWAPDAAETEELDIASAVAATSNSSHEVAFQSISAGATGTRTAVASGSGVTTINWVAYSVVVKPSGGGGPHTYNLTTTDSWTASETLTRLYGAVRTATDSTTYAETLTRVLGLVRVATDSRTYGEALTRVLAMVRAATDSRTYAEAITRAATFLRTATDALTDSEVITSLKSIQRAATDAITYAEVITRAGTFVRATTDAITESEVVVRVVGVVRSLVDSRTYAEGISRLVSVVRSATDAASYAETISRVVGVVRSTSDAKTLSEVVTRLMTMARVVSDGETYAEVVTRIGTFARSISDALGYAEAVIAEKSGVIVKTATDALTYAESVTRIGTFARTLTDSRTYAEAVVGLRVTLRSVADAITYSDAATRIQTSLRSTVDAVTKSDAATRILNVARTATDSRTYAEVVSRVKDAVRSVVDAITYVDVATRLSLVARSTSDALSYAEVVARQAGAIIMRGLFAVAGLVGRARRGGSSGGLAGGGFAGRARPGAPTGDLEELGIIGEVDDE